MDPAAGTAYLLRRLGFAVLTLVLPSAALISRRAAVILVPTGIVLLIIAALIDPVGDRFSFRFKQALRSTPILLLLVLAGWTTLSLAWTPFPEDSAGRWAIVLGLGALTIMAIWSLPSRMRASTLNLLPLGAGIGAIIACIMAVGETQRWWSLGRDVEGLIVDRGLILIALFAFVGMGWLVSRGRGWDAIPLAIAAIGSTFLLGSRATLVAVVVGLATFSLALWRQRAVAFSLIVLLPAIILLAPLFALVAHPPAKALLGPLDPITGALKAIADMVRGEPLRLLTGHGFDTGLRALVAGLVASSVPHSALFDLWYELGLLGAVFLAAILALTAQRALLLNTGVAAGLLAVMTCAFVYSLAGLGVLQTWWITSLSAVILGLRAIERGQFRTTRPRARLFSPSPRD